MSHLCSLPSKFGFIPVVLVTLGLSMDPVAFSAPIQHGTNAETTCEVVSAGQYYCTIDGKGYYCDTKTNPDPNKNCRPAKMVPSGPKGTIDQGTLKNAPIMRRGIEGEPTGEAEQVEKGFPGDIQERAVKKPKPGPVPPGTPPTFPK
ncbi:hypothetical protein YTPLAS18_07480 [Nitrospira sp.]|nr:hypothetical protein YTPLAS18_07480 [Nitrospira sp.]